MNGRFRGKDGELGEIWWKMGKGKRIESRTKLCEEWRPSQEPKNLPIIPEREKNSIYGRGRANLKKMMSAHEIGKTDAG